MGTVTAMEIQTGFLGALEPAEREALAERSTARTFARGDALFNERDKSDRVVVILSGRVKAYSITGDGKEVVFAFRGAGDLLGELAAIDGRPRSASVTALEPVRALTIAPSDFRAFLERHPRVALLLLEMITHRLRDADRKRVEFAAHDTIGRVAARLVDLAREHGETTGTHVQITLPLSQDELAGWTGASRESVARALRALRALGWVDTARRRIIVLDLDALRRRSS